MSCFNTTHIDKTECIGNSLNKINNNFEGLKEAVCDNDNTINIIKSDINNLDTKINALSSIVVPGLTRAWIKFDGTRDASNNISTFKTNRFIYSSFNISSVLRKDIGDYRITFNTPFPTQNYILIGTSSQKQNSTGQYTWFQPYTFRTTYVDVRVNGTTPSIVADPEHCSVIIF
jgi:hypothetical protein